MHRAKKNLGQNFLEDRIVLQEIIDSIKPNKKDSFLEIGPGKGSLTELITGCVETLDAVELDRDLILGLRLLAQKEGNLTIHKGDILAFDIEENLKPKKKLRVIGNLPYNISSSIMLWSFLNQDKFVDLHYMFQKEFGQRLSSDTGTKSYGRLSVLTQYMAKVSNLFIVNPESFKPAPAVESIFIKLVPIPGRDLNSPIAKKLQEITRIAFSKRRKMLSKSYKDILGKEDFEYLNIESSQRPEDLTVEDFLKISNLLIQA